MNIKNIQYITVVVGIFSIAIALIAVLSGVLGHSYDARRIGIIFAVIGLVLFCINMIALMVDYINTRRVASGRPDFAYYNLKRKTRKELEVFMNYEDITTAAGIRRDFLMRAKSYGIDPTVALDDYEHILETIRND